MIKATIVSPTKAILEVPDGDRAKLESICSYKNTSSEYQYRRHMKNFRWRNSNQEAWKAHGEALRQDANRSLLFQENGNLCIRPGYLPYLKELFQIEIINQVSYPRPRPYPWYKPIKFTPYPYQTEAVDRLLAERHGSIELFTGAGKSLILLMLTQRLGLKTLIITPSVSIFGEMLERFEEHFGKASVGAFGGGKKRLGKNIIVCVSDSLANLKPGTKEYEEISNFQVMLSDESHTNPSKTLEKMCHGVLKDIPYRFFVSGTQTRSDGTEKLLHSIIGKTVLNMTTKEGVDGGFICDHEFRIVKVQTTRPGFNSDDALAMKRAHFLHNDNIAAFIGKLANSAYKTRGEQTLVLVDEIDQIHRLIKHLEIPYACATGDKSFDKPDEAVEKFNKGEAKILIGTSCISTGTNIFPTHHTINWQGGTSEVKVKQGAVGRSVRKLKGSDFEKFHVPKEKAIIWDFDVISVPIMERHLKERISYYKDSGVAIVRL